MRSLIKKSNLKNLLNMIFELDLRAATTSCFIVFCVTIAAFFASIAACSALAMCSSTHAQIA